MQQVARADSRQDLLGRISEDLAASSEGTELVRAVLGDGDLARGQRLAAVPLEGLQTLTTGVSAVRRAAAHLAPPLQHTRARARGDR